MVKKLPVLFIGNISIINKNIKGIIILLYFKFEFKKYFLKKVIYKVIEKIKTINTKPTNPVSVKISKYNCVDAYYKQIFDFFSN